MNKEKLEYWALVSEIVGGVAVLVTLVILVIEVRGNTETLRAATYDSLVADLSNWRLQNALSDELVELFLQEYSELPPEGQDRRRNNVLSIYFIFERAFIQWQAGNLNDEAWERFSRTICDNYSTQLFQEEFNAAIDRFTTVAFQEFRRNECADGT